jgi:UDP-N-acetylmuramate dehydrogenase
MGRRHAGGIGKVGKRAMTALTAPALLPNVRGLYTENASLSEVLWFRVGGPAEILFRPADIDDLCAFMAQCPPDIPLTMIGVGSNLLVRDGGIEGVVIRLPSAFGQVAQIAPTRIRAGAAALDSMVARKAADAGIAGLEFLRGIPGTIGGALRMNAGCYGREMKDILVEARAVNAQGEIITLSSAEMGFSYRRSAAPENLILIDAVLEGTSDDCAAIRARMEKLVAEREATQPVRAKTGGSTFTNPSDAKAWQLIDRAGCRGLKNGDAQVSEKHCNFLINLNQASAADIEALGEEVRRRVKEKSGVDLKWEIKRVGKET